MKKELINTIKQGMLGILNNEQLAKLHDVLELSFTLFAECSATRFLRNSDRIIEKK